MKNRIIAVLLTAAMMVSAAGCGKQITSAQNVTEEASVEAETEQAAQEQTAQDQPVEEAAAEASAETEAEAAAEEPEVEFSTGTVDGNVYENQYFGLKVTVPADYSFIDDETLAQLSGMAADIMKDNKAAAAALDNGTAAIVAYANKQGAADNINVTIQSNASLANALMDEKAVMTVSMGQLQSVLESQGAEITYIDVVEKEVAGETHYVLELEGTINGMDLSERVVNFQKGDYMLAVAASCFNSDDVDTLMEGIEKN